MSEYTPFIFWEMIGFTTKKRHDKINLGSTPLLLNKINNYGTIMGNNYGKLDLSESIKSIFRQLINIIPKQLYAQNKRT